MSDIHQEWNELRQKNSDFINHLDGEMAKLKQDKQLQDLLDAGAFAMQFIAPPQFNCCQDDRDILKALNKAQADRIKYLEDEFLACKEQQRVDQAVKKDLDEKLDKAAADYKALWVERDNLMATISRMEKTIRDLDERNGTLRERLAKTNESLKRSVQREIGFQNKIDYLEHLRQCQAKEIERLRKIVEAQNGSCSAYAQQGMQSKIAKQANEIKRLTEENEQLKHNNDILIKELQFRTQKISDQNWEIQNLKGALNQAAKDADANFERGKIKGMEEIWDELRETYRTRVLSENEKIFGYGPVGEIVDNLSPTWFMNKAREYHEQEEEARDIKLGDQVEILNLYDPGDNHPHSAIGVVTAIDNGSQCFAVIGPKFKACFDETDIQAGNVRKTGQHFDSIPLDYFT